MLRELKKSLCICCGLLSLLLCQSGVASAGNQVGGWTLSPMAGAYVFDGDQYIKDKPAYSFGLGYNFTEKCSAEFFLQHVKSEYEYGSREDVEVTNVHLDGLYHFANWGGLVPYFAVGFGLMSSDPASGKVQTNPAPNYGLGLKYFLSENVALRLDARHMIGFDQGLDEWNETDNNYTYLAGLTFQVPPKKTAPKDSDGDGVIDERDRCPGTPTGVQVDADGCPQDSDKDGVPDYLDHCPNTPAGVQVDSNGCPPDSDKDGVPDYLDKCPGTPAGVQVDSNGCPKDSDKDGVPDYLDKCPATPAGVKVDANGCPPDSDQDGVLDYLDRCPNTPKGVMVDDHGCPISLALHINFDTDKAVIKPEYYSELDKAVAFINKYPGNMIMVAGHTDSQGAEDYNQGLSERRAKAVREFLVTQRGIAASKLVARGYGEVQPVADNATAAGRAQNRRVEIVCCAVIPD